MVGIWGPHVQAQRVGRGFSLRLSTMASQLQVLGDSIVDKDVIKKLLHIVPEKLEQVLISIETLLDLDSLSIEEAVGHLRVVEQRKKPLTTKDSDGRLLLMEEWLSLEGARRFQLELRQPRAQQQLQWREVR
jgi:hypothetical protein